MNTQEKLKQVARSLKNSQYAVAFTGAGISVESGIPPFRGQNGLWSQYDPKILDLNYFYRHPKESWQVIQELFYTFFGKSTPNAAHRTLSAWEEKKIIKSIITQNIDNLHQEAGSQTVYEYHGTAQSLICLDCQEKYHSTQVSFSQLPPRCSCQGILKPDFIFFGEGIPAYAAEHANQETLQSDLFLIIGTTGEVMPASTLPHLAKKNGAKIIEINPQASTFTNTIVDIHVNGKAGEILPQIASLI